MSQALSQLRCAFDSRYDPRQEAGASLACTLTMRVLTQWVLGHGAVWDVHIAVVHFTNASEQQRESGRKKVSGGGENYTRIHEPGQQSL